MTLFAYGAAVSAMLTAPRSGKQARGSNAVAAIGIASVAHQTAINTATAAVDQPASVNPSGASLSSIRMASNGPRISPILWWVERPSSDFSVSKCFFVRFSDFDLHLVHNWLSYTRCSSIPCVPTRYARRWDVKGSAGGTPCRMHDPTAGITCFLSTRGFCEGCLRNRRSCQRSDLSACFRMTLKNIATRRFRLSCVT